MDRPYFPMFVDISGKKVVIAGGGTIALRRCRTLLKFGADIHIVALKLCAELEILEKEKKIRAGRREFQAEDIKGADIVIAATDQKEVNRRIWKLCRERQILVNVADDHTLCDFYFPSVVMSEEFVVGISSGGEAPKKVKEARREIESVLTENA